MPGELPVVRVEFGAVEDARRVVLGALAGVPERQRARLAARVVADLRAAGCLGAVVEQHFSAQDCAALLGRSPRHVADECKRGNFGRVFFDAGGWMIPASGVEAWLQAREYQRQGVILEGIAA